MQEPTKRSTDRKRRNLKAKRRSRLTAEQFRALAQETFDDVAEGGRGLGLSLRWRFGILLAIAALLVSWVAWEAVTDLRQAHSHSRALVQERLQPTEQLVKLKSLVYENQLQVLNAQGTPLPFILQQASDNVDRNNMAINRIWSGLKDSLKLADELSIVSDLKVSMEYYQIACRLQIDSLMRKAKVAIPDSSFQRARTSSFARTRFTDRDLDNLFVNVILPRFDEINAGLARLIEIQVREGNTLVTREIDSYAWRSTLVGIVALVGLAALILWMFLLYNGITDPMHRINRALLALSRGDLSRKRLPISEDEIGEVALNLHGLTNSLRRVASFASEIGEGNFKTEFKPLGESDQLGAAMTNMRDRLAQVVEDEHRRNWSVAGFAQFSEILRLSEDEQHLSERIITSLAKYIEANQGAFFLLKDEDPNDLHLTLSASYAYNKKKSTHREFRLGEGFVGQSAVEREVISISDIPTDYITMTSGLGEAPPRSLLIVPLVYNDVVYGVVEFASFTRFHSWQIDFVKRLSETIGAALANLKGRSKTLQLLKESQALSSELQNQQKTLLETNRALEERETEILKATTELRGQISALNNSGIVSETNLDGVITFANDRFLAVSRFSRDEILGETHRIIKSDATPADVFLNLWDTITRGKVWKGELKNRAKDGTLYWVDATITPVLGPDSRPVKYISVQFDITNQRVQEEQIRTALEQSMSQEEELRQNAEELEAQQEEMRRTQIELVGQISALNNAAIVSEADLQGRIITVNDQFIAMSRYTREELIGQNHRLLKSGHQSDDLFEKLWKSITQGNVWRGEFKNRAKDGTFYWVTASITPVLDSNGQPVKYIGVQFDITAQKLQEEQIRAALEISQAQEAELRQNAEELQAAQEEMRKTQIELRGQIGALNNAGIVAETDLRGNITLVNEEFCRLSKYPREELIGTNHRMLKSGYHSDEFYIELWTTLTRGQVWHGVFRNLAADGTYYWVKSSITPVLGFDGKPVKYIGVSFDITAQVEQEEKIQHALELSQAQEEQLRHNAEIMTAQQIELAGQISALNNAGILSETDTEGRISYVNDAAVATWGYSREEILGKNHNLIRSSEHDEAFFSEMWQTIAAGEVWKGEVKNTNKDGVDFWVMLTISPVLGADGKPVKYIGLAFDITKQRRQASRIRQFLELSQKQEEELRQSAEKLKLAQLELAGQIGALNNSAIVSETDLSGNLTFVNDEATFLWGYSREELLGQPHNILKSGHHGPEFFERLWDKISAGFLWRGEIKNKAKDGTEFWVELSITPVLDAEGKPMKYIGVAFDITKTKNQSLRIREALKQAEAQEETYRTRIAELETQVSGAPVAAVAADAAEQLALVQQLQRQVDSLQAELAVAKVQPHADPEELTALQSALAANETQLQQAEQRAQQALEQANEYQTRVQEMEMVLADARAQLAEMASRPAVGAAPQPASYELILDLYGNVQQAPLSFAERLHLPMVQILGRHFTDLTPAAERARLFDQQLWQRLPQAQQLSEAVLFQSGMGNTFSLNCTFSLVFNAQGEASEFHVLAADALPTPLEMPVAKEAPGDSTLASPWGILANAAILSETDQRGVITEVNDAFCALSGYTREQLIGQSHNLVRSPETPASVFFEMWALIGRGKQWSGELQNQRQDGSRYWLQLTILPVLGTNGRPERYMAVAFEITQLKKYGPLANARQQAAIVVEEAELNGQETVDAGAAPELAIETHTAPPEPEVPAPLKQKRQEVADKQHLILGLQQQLQEASGSSLAEELRRQCFYEEQELRALLIELELIEQQYAS